MKRTSMATAIGAAALLATAPAALASTVNHTVVTVGGDSSPGLVPVTGTNDGAIELVTDFGVPMTCNASAIIGVVDRGAAVNVGLMIGRITDLTFSHCNLTNLHYAVVVEKDPGDWGIEVRSHPAHAGDPVPITIKNVSASMHSNLPRPDGNPATTGDSWACDLGAIGDVNGTFYPATAGNDGRIQIDTNSAFPLALSAYDGEGTKTPLPSTSGTCFNQIYTGDKADMDGDFNVDTNGAGGISHG